MDLYLFPLIVWSAIVIGIFVMKKIEPRNKVYPVYAILVGILYTIIFIFNLR